MEVQENQSGTWTTVAEYDYDAKGRGIVKTVSNSGNLNGTTRYIWGGQSDWQCLEEFDGSDNIQARYTYAPGGLPGRVTSALESAPVASQKRESDPREATVTGRA